MSQKRILISAITFFVLINTTYFWEGTLGIWAMLATIALVVYYLALTIVFFRQAYLLIREKFHNRQRVLTSTILILVLVSTTIYPNGIFNFEGNAVFVAQREGVANCMTTLKLEENGKFSETSVCFGATKITGRYTVKQDTIFFEDISSGRISEDFYKYAVINPGINESSVFIGYLDYYNSANSKVNTLRIVKNDLK